MKQAQSRGYLVGGAVAALVAAAGLGYLLIWHPVSQPLTQVTPGGQVAAAGQATIVQEGTAPAPPPGSDITVEPSGVHVDAAVIAHSAPPPEGYIEYRNAQYGFSFYHTPQSRVTFYDEGGGAATITLENFAKMRGFQVFIVPYTESKISEARFAQDVPSGVRKNIEATTLDGVTAVTFNSEDALLGPTREIWVLRGGYLYEITTFSGVGDWFTPIIQSWRFL